MNNAKTKMPILRHRITPTTQQQYASMRPLQDNATDKIVEESDREESTMTDLAYPEPYLTWQREQRKKDKEEKK